MFEISRRALLAAGSLPILGLPALAADAPWRIGFVSATSGPLKETGDSTAVAIKLAVDEINAKGGVEGHKLDFIQYDTSSDPRQASVAVRTWQRTRRCWRSSARCHPLKPLSPPMMLSGCRF